MFGTSRNDWMNQWFRNELRSVLGEPSGRWQRAATRSAAGVFPPVNIYDDGESYLVRAELAGVAPEELDVNAKGDQIVIRGTRVVHTPDPEANMHRREREGGEFRRAVTLPQEIEPSKVDARLEHGVLEIRAPRSARAKPRQIKVKS